MIAAILMMFMTRYTKGRRHRAEAATLTLRLAYKLLDDLQTRCLREGSQYRKIAKQSELSRDSAGWSLLSKAHKCTGLLLVTCTAKDDAACHEHWRCHSSRHQPSAHCGRSCSRPDNEVDAGHSRVEEDDAVDYESNSFPESIKGTACLNLDVDVPLVGCCSI